PKNIQRSRTNPGLMNPAMKSGTPITNPQKNPDTTRVVERYRSQHQNSTTRTYGQRFTRSWSSALVPYFCLYHHANARQCHDLVLICIQSPFTLEVRPFSLPPSLCPTTPNLFPSRRGLK